MTSNQISYWNYLELVRSNRAKEAETQRSNLAKESETARANRMQEQIAYDRYLEEARANRAAESIKMASISEERRHNTVSESINWVQADKWKSEASLTSQKEKTERFVTANTAYTSTMSGAKAKLADDFASAELANTKSGTFRNYASGVGDIVDAILTPLKVGFVW